MTAIVIKTHPIAVGLRQADGGQDLNLRSGTLGQHWI